jgi:hypothetical protein
MTISKESRFILRCYSGKNENRPVHKTHSIFKCFHLVHHSPESWKKSSVSVIYYCEHTIRWLKRMKIFCTQVWNLGRAQWGQLVSTPLGINCGGLKGGGWNHLMARSHVWRLMVAVGWDLSGAVGWNTYSWSLCVDWASSQYGGWVPRVNISR